MSSTLLFATDLHGNAPGYEQLLHKAVAAQAAAIVLGGDLCPHARPPGQAAFLHTWLAPRLRRFRDEHRQIRVFGMLGNDDWGVLEPELQDWEQEGAFYCLHQRAHKLTAELWIAGSSFVPVTPFGMSDFDRFDAPDWKPPAKLRPPLFSVGRSSGAGRKPEACATGELIEGTMGELSQRETLEECLDALAKLSTPARTVYVFHAPPARTELDQICGRTHVGSLAIRRFIEKHQPPLTLHGHIHESPLVTGSVSDTIGQTVSLNPGDSQTKLRALLVSLGGAQIRWEGV
ncbi:MAG: metallophosphoesterase [Planctomycetota bacterium]